MAILRFPIGLLIGGTLPFVVASMTMKSVGRAAEEMIKEIRRQFKEIDGLLEGREGVEPDSATCVDISTKAALREMVAPGVVAISSPVIVGFLLGASALGGMLAGAPAFAIFLRPIPDSLCRLQDVNFPAVPSGHERRNASPSIRGISRVQYPSVIVRF